ncbi:polysaccharide pyruvyl transferase family protein [[Ruminococcus] lactaris]|nr:polysaccharide pyruvyl transferase family protein [[Ruminococcus] lactaris]
MSENIVVGQAGGEKSRNKIGLITIHRVLNYGTAWQVYSTVQILKKYCKDVTVIDYIPNRLKIAKTKDFLFEVNPIYRNSWKKIPYLALKIPTRILEKRGFDRFISKRIPLTKKKFFDVDDLKEIRNDFDIFVTGSDQVWNYEEELQSTIDKAYLLGFFECGEQNKKIAFSASFGRNSFNDKIMRDIEPYIRDYSAISVREESGLDILSQIGYKNAVHSLDPTLILGKDNLIDLASKKLVKGKYVLIYALSPNPLVDKMAQFVAKEKGLKIIKLCNTLEKKSYIDKYFRFRRPEDFLSLFYNADYIVTNSFHGTAFSVNFEKQFSVIAADKFETRMVDFLKSVKLEKRLIVKEKDFQEQLEIIQFDESRKIIKNNRQKMENFLKKNIGEI